MKKITTSQAVSQLITVLDKLFIKPVAHIYKAHARPLQIHALVFLGENAYTMTELANDMRLPKQQLTLIIDRVVKKGLVQREFDDIDRRIIRIRLTPAGLEWLHKLKQMEIDVITAKLDSLDKESYMTLTNALSEVQRILKKIPQEK